jgi:hypothetical protein
MFIVVGLVLIIHWLVRVEVLLRCVIVVLLLLTVMGWLNV